MPSFTTEIPLSLYIHLPWCVRKCPYCDFNSHANQSELPEKEYVDALLDDLATSYSYVENRSLVSIFFGGGTPSLFSAKSIANILEGVSRYFSVPGNLEITLEANPGTTDAERFVGFYQAGINRLSIGVQSFQTEKLALLGRIHSSHQAKDAIYQAKDAGFRNINVDIMYGLPEQNLNDALYDVETALSCQPTHFSWYQLTIEPNTLFHHQRPALPTDDLIWDMQCKGLELIKQAGFDQYEVSAYSQPDRQCLHNLNYWQFGDYLGIGAGAHSKVTTPQGILRFAQIKHPRDYLQVEKRRNVKTASVQSQDLIFEFMLNALRLNEDIPFHLFEARTGLSKTMLEKTLKQAQSRGFIADNAEAIRVTPLGRQFLNNLMTLFLPH